MNLERNIAMEPEDPEVTKNFDMPEPAYFRYLQYQKTKDEKCTAGLFELRNRITVAGQTYFSHLWVVTIIIVTGRAYFSYSQHLKMKESELNTRNQLLRKIMGTKSVSLILQTKKTAAMKIDVTQAGSECLLTQV